MIVKSDLKEYKDISSITNDVRISKLPQLYRADMEFAKAQGNEELNKILDQVQLSGKYKHVSIDSRSHMLMKDMYPCIPGWHCDDFYRTKELNDQPDLANVDEKAPAIHHILVIGDCSRTEFTANDFFLPEPNIVQVALDKMNDNSPVYKWYDETIDQLTKSHLKTVHVEPGKLYTFGPTAFHRGQAAQHNGWRYFIRITESNHREPKNEIRYQTQVYTLGRVSW